MDWDDAFSNGAYIEGAADIAASWVPRARAFRKACPPREIDYGAGPRERYDLFIPDQSPHGLFIFVHGGYWIDFDKSVWSHLAGGAVARGWAAALPSYDLCPGAGIDEITLQIASMLTHSAGEIDGPIVVCGHSAGGHLAARMVCRDVQFADYVGSRIHRVLSISGLFDLAPLMETQMNEKLQLTPEIARAESPVYQSPRPGTRMTLWAGAEERPEFHRQSGVMKDAWYGRADIALVTAPGLHHFNVIDGLADPESDLMRAALAD